MKFKAFLASIIVIITIIATGASNQIMAQDEVVSLRSWNSDHYDNKDGTMTAKIYPKWINYMDEKNEWQPIDINFIEKGNIFTVDKAPFIANVPKWSNGTAEFISNNRYDPETKSQILEPPIIQYITAIGVNKVKGEIETGNFGWGETTYVIYHGAYPDIDADLIYVVHKGSKTRLHKIIRFNEAIQSDVDLDFNLSLDHKTKIKKVDIGSLWSENSVLSTKKAIQFFDSDLRGISLREFRIWDSGSKNELIDVEMRKVNGDYVLRKKIPFEFFEGSTYPVFTDATFNPDADPESTSVDGYAARFYSAGEAYSTIRGGAGTTSNSSAGTGFTPRLRAGTTTDLFRDIYRGIFLFDTSSIGSGNIVTASDFEIYVNSVIDNATLDQSVGLTASNPASNTDIVNSDYSNFSDTRFASDIDLGSLSTTAYNTMSMNSSGISAVNIEGITKLALRFDSDIDNSAPTWVASGDTLANVTFADNGSNEPVLDVTYEASGWSNISTLSSVDVSTISTVNGVDEGSVASINGVLTSS